MHPSMLLASQFNTMHAVIIAVIAVLLVCSAFFSASETAFNTMNMIRIRSMAENKVKGARRALWISEHSDRILTTILVGNNIINILSTTLCAFVLADLIDNDMLMNVLNTVVMTIIILITGEILPKAMAKANPEKYACRFAGIMFVLSKILYPIVICFYGLQKFATRKKNQEKSTVTVTEDELESIIDTMEEEGVLEKDEADIIQGTFKIKEATAHDIMTHRVDVVFLNIESTTEEIEKTFIEHQYSRMPVYKETTDMIVGILNIKDFFNAKIEGKDLELSQLMTTTLFVAENTSVDTLIKEMQKVKKHMAIVLDENGGVSGIVTMEDCVETIFGEIYDETDQDEQEPILEQIGDDEYEMDSEISIEELFDRLEIETLPENPYQSVNAFLFDLFEDIAEEGKVYDYFTIDEIIDGEGNLTQHKINMKFTIVKMEAHRIKKIRLKIIYQNDEEKTEEDKKSEE
ncbi:MAG: HlyC/CorC family transporter [Clostridiales bacterium]|nr:HlyC/CorC family transporter [Clostridiales bacterium]